MSESVSFNIGALARRSGIPDVTLRAWERRYGVPKPARTKTGRRQYSEEDLSTVIRMRQLVAEGVAPSVAARHVRGLDAGGSQLATSSPRLAQGYAERLVSACIAYDETRADAILSDAFLVYSVERVCIDVIEPMLRRIGELWWREELPVAAEHIASSLIRDRIATLSRSFAFIESNRFAVQACPPGELHEIGPAMLGLFLRRRGWRVLSLGANTPLREIERVSEALRPTVVILSATQFPAARQANDICDRLAPRLASHETMLAVGGQGFAQVPDKSPGSSALRLPLQVQQAVEALDEATSDAQDM